MGGRGGGGGMEKGRKWREIKISGQGEEISR